MILATDVRLGPHGIVAGIWQRLNHRVSAGVLAAFGRQPPFVSPDVKDFARRERLTAGRSTQAGVL
jgi:hypothetical protein